jgi:N,N'-diacetyllegionaminate synthase
MNYSFSIANKVISPDSPVFLIAEIGVNHNGDVELAKSMISSAKKAGADAVKFQTFTAEALVSQGTNKVAYQKSTTDPAESHYDMIRRLELSKDHHRELFRYCAHEEIIFLSTPYDIDSAKFLIELGISAFKTASADIVDLPLLSFLASTHKPVIAATGMANLGEVEDAVNIFRKSGNNQLVLLHCVSNYPCSWSSLNLRAMQTLANAFHLPVGYSDHSEGTSAAEIATTLGARVIEKHFTLDKSLPGPDHKASDTPEQFRQLVDAVRRTEIILGDPSKIAQTEELEMASISRKSIVTRETVPQGEVLTMESLTLKRPGTGLLAKNIPSVLGKRVRRTLNAGHQLNWSDLE